MCTTTANWQQSNSDQLLSNLLNEVKVWEGTLGNQTTLGPGATSVANLLQSKVILGYPQDKLTLLTQAKFSQVTGTPLNIIYQGQMGEYNFYYLSLQVGLIPEPGVQFSRLICQLDFDSQDDQKPIIIQSIFPNEKWREVLNAGIGMDIGLDESLDWQARVDTSVLNQLLPQLPAGIQAKVKSKNDFKAFVEMPAYKYEFGDFEIIATGVGSEAYWRMDDQGLKKTGTVEFATVFKVSQTIKQVKLDAQAWAEPNINWLFTDIKNVASQLSDQLKALFRVSNKEAASSSLGRGEAKTWYLPLPQQ